MHLKPGLVAFLEWNASRGPQFLPAGQSSLNCQRLTRLNEGGYSLLPEKGVSDMPQKRWIVLIDWVDGAVEDTDKFSVPAETQAEAIIAAMRSFVEATKNYPHRQIEQVTFLTDDSMPLA
jgi:hypothetical protein